MKMNTVSVAGTSEKEQKSSERTNFLDIENGNSDQDLYLYQASNCVISRSGCLVIFFFNFLPQFTYFNRGRHYISLVI